MIFKLCKKVEGGAVILFKKIMEHEDI